MENFMITASEMWDKFAGGGAYAIQKFVFALSGYELNEVAALVIFLGSMAGIVLWLLLLAKRPRKTAYLMESGYRHHRNYIKH